MPDQPCYCDECTKPKPGLYQKFRVERIIGTDKPGEEFLVLSPTHDLMGRAAIRVYAQECRESGLNDIADDLLDALDRVSDGKSFRICSQDVN